MKNKDRYTASRQPGLSANATALLLSCTDFCNEQAVGEVLQQAEQLLGTDEEEKTRQAAYRLINILRIYHLAVSCGDKQFFGYALQKAFGEWASLKQTAS